MTFVAERWQGRRVFLTGHTGFKGSWMALWLARMGAAVCGYSLAPETVPNLFTEARVGGQIAQHVVGDIRNAAHLLQAMEEFAPEVVFHMAAQPLVRLSYADPITTYETNVMGTARLLEAVRKVKSVRAVVVITTDKVYSNPETNQPFVEGDPLGGFDPYSSSKACAEIATAAWRNSFFPPAQHKGHGVGLATARAGNVIGGGDWSSDRLIPDLVRGFLAGAPVPIRSPHAVRPWQHVLESIQGYLLLAEKLLGPQAAEFSRAFNFGPAEADAKPVDWIATRLVETWGEGASWYLDDAVQPHEASYLRLDATRAMKDLDWAPRLPLPRALDALVHWYKAHAAGEDMQVFTLKQIATYEAVGK